MTTKETLSNLKKMLYEAGIKDSTAEPSAVWAVFKKSAEIPVICEEEALLFECGTYDFTGDELFRFAFVRQFAMGEDEEDPDDECAIWQLRCQFSRKPDSSSNGLQASLWSYDFETNAEFFNAVEALPEFKKSLEMDGWRLEISQENVE